MATLVVSSLLVRVVAPGRGGAGFRLAFQGEIAAAEKCDHPPTVVVSVAAVHGSARAEARGPLGSVVQGRFRVESGLLGGAGEYAFEVRLEEREPSSGSPCSESLYSGSVAVDTVGVGFAVAPQHLLDSAMLWFDDAGSADAPVLASAFWCADTEVDPEADVGVDTGSGVGADVGAAQTDAEIDVGADAAERAAPGGRAADLSATLFCNGLPILSSDDPGEGRRPGELRVVDSLDAPDATHRLRQVQLRLHGARAFVLADVPGVHDLSANPGVYAVRITRGPKVISRLTFEIDWHGVLRESGPIECRADGTRVMLLGAGRRFGPPPPGGATTLDPVYARYFAALRGPQRVMLDELQRRALDRLAADLSLSEGVLELLDPDVGRAALHELLTRVEEFESLLPDDFPVVIDHEQVPFERLRPYVLRRLAELDGGPAVVATPG
ncbi:hypothetical protein ACEXQE_14510 [Herbiconiux sp. P17]|uniref:hypothetical protein n=1 Tax=Herbiconiux wuyangfengii TaxID=3342794 RepID=UPI0035BACF79